MADYPTAVQLRSTDRREFRQRLTMAARGGLSLAAPEINVHFHSDDQRAWLGQFDDHFGNIDVGEIAPSPRTEVSGSDELRDRRNLSGDVATRNVAAQAADPTSVLSFYRRLLWLRRAQPALHRGSLRSLAVNRDVLSYERQLDDDVAHVVLNFGNRAAEVTLPHAPAGRTWTAVLSTHDPYPTLADARFRIRPREAAIFLAR